MQRLRSLLQEQKHKSECSGYFMHVPKHCGGCDVYCTSLVGIFRLKPNVFYTRLDIGCEISLELQQENVAQLLIKCRVIQS